MILNLTDSSSLNTISFAQKKSASMGWDTISVLRKFMSQDAKELEGTCGCWTDSQDFQDVSWSSLIWETVRIAWRASDMKCPRCTKRVAVWLLTLLLLQVSQAMCPKKALDKPRRGMVAVKSDLSDSTWSGSWNKPVDTVKQQGLMLWDWMQIDMSSNMLKYAEINCDKDMPVCVMTLFPSFR